MTPYRYPELVAMYAQCRSDAERRVVRAQLVENAREDPGEFAPHLYLTDAEDANEPLYPRPFHREWLDALHDDSVEKLLLLAARGHAKSVYVSGVDALWDMCKHPHQRTLLITASDDLAIRYTTELRDKLLGDVVREIFPELPKIRKANQHEIYLEGGQRDPTFKAVGAGTAITSLRADKIILDDVVTIEHRYSETLRQQLVGWYFTTLRPILVPGGKIRVVGTPYHEEDLYATLEERGFKTLRYPAIDWEGKYLWPERFDARTLAILDAEDHGSFSSQYLLEPIVEGDTEFTRAMFEVVEPAHVPRFVLTATVWDGAISEKKAADRTAKVTGGVSGEGVLYLTHAASKQVDPEKAKQWMEADFREHPVRFCGVEDTKEARVFQAWFNNSRSHIPLVLIPHGGLSKYQRSSIIKPFAEAGRIKLVRGNWNEQFLHEVCSFTADGRAAHDDITDAFVYLTARIFGCKFSPIGRQGTVVRAGSLLPPRLTPFQQLLARTK